MLEFDNMVAEAVSEAAATLTSRATDNSFLEARLEERVVRSLEERLPPGWRVSARKKLLGVLLPDWDPQPGTIDVAVLDEHQQLRVAIELKVDDVPQTLWDILKMASAGRLTTVDAAYVAVAARSKDWNGSRDCVALFAVDDTPDKDWYTSYLFSEYHRAWEHDLSHGTGRPTRVPLLLSLKNIGAFSVPGYGDYELRVLRVKDLPTDAWVTLKGGWPQRTVDDALMNEIPDDKLALSDIPAPRADEMELHRFALTTNGYARMGTSAACGELANTAKDCWEADGTLPANLRDLRCCLFFEQRRFHHFGDSFDPRTLQYARELIEAIRRIVGGGSSVPTDSRL